LLVAKLSDVAVLAARLLLEVAFKAAFNVPALDPVVVFVPEAFEVSLAATAPPAAVVLLAAVPTLEEVLPPLAELLLNDELPAVPAVPFGPAAARLPVVPEDDVELLPFELFAVAPSDAPRVWLLLAVTEPVLANAFVVPLALLELSAATLVVPLDLFEVAAKSFVVPLDLLELEEAEDASDAVKLLLAPACCCLVLLELNISEELFVSERSLEYVLALLLVAFNEELTLDVDVSILVTFELLLTVSSLFSPR
jgi:hypothetical protein